MAKNKISEFSATASNNTDIGGINIAEGCAPSGINNAIRELMAQLKDQQAGTDGDGFTVGGAFTSSGGAVFSSGSTFSGSVVMSSTVAISGNATLTGATNTIGTTTSSTILTGSVTQTSGSVLYLDAAATTSAAPPLSWSSDTNTGIYRPAADTLALVTGGSDRFRINSSGVVIIGSGEDTGTVSGNVLRAPSASGTNIAGSNFEIQAGNGTGTGGSGNIVLKTADVGSSGSTANTLTQRLLITPKGGFSFGSGATSYGTAGQVLKSNGDAPPTFGDSGPTALAVQTASGTSVDFTGIPSTAKKITVMYSGLYPASNSTVVVRLGTSSAFEDSSYLGAIVGNAGGATLNFSSGFNVANGVLNATIPLYGILTLCNINGNTWVATINSGRTDSAAASYGAGSKTLSGALSQIRFTTTGGTVSFSGGSLNIIYE